MKYTLEQIMSAIDSHAEKVIEQIEKQETLGAGDVADVTSKTLQISKVKQRLENIKLSITRELTKDL